MVRQDRNVSDVAEYIKKESYFQTGIAKDRDYI